MTDIFIGVLLIAVIVVLAVSVLILKVIRIYVQESMYPRPFATAEEKEAARMAAERAEAEKPKKPALWTKLMGLKPISEEKDLVMKHTFDGIAELDNPTPAWFMVLFYGTVIFAMVYLLSYHVFGIGMLQDEEYAVELKQADEAKTAMLLKPGNASAKVNENNVTLSKEPAVLQSGAAIFKGACTPCHGEHAEGLVGPNLTDEYWLHGGTISDIFKTIKYGVPEKGMIAWEKTLRPKQISELSNYILSLQGTKPAGAKAPQGNKL